MTSPNKNSKNFLRVRLGSRFTVSIFFPLSPFFFFGVGHAELSKQDIGLIRQYEELTGASFADFFANAVHQLEACGDEGSVCETVLHKRVEDYTVFFDGHHKLENKATLDVVRLAFLQAVTDVRDATGLELLPNTGGPYENYIVILFHDPGLYKEDPEAYVDGRIARPEYNLLEYRRNQYQFFLDNDIPCIALRAVNSDGILKDVHIWIKGDLPDRKMHECIAEELFNSLGIDEGVDVPSIFDWPMSDFNERGGLSHFHLMLLRILYREDFAVGQTKIETLVKIDRLLEASGLQ